MAYANVSYESHCLLFVTKRTRRAQTNVVAAIFSLVCAGCTPHGSPRVLSVAAAADLRFAMEALSRGFHSAHPGIDLRIAYGSSGNFYAQIRNQAPFDLFLSADMEYPRQLIRHGIAASDALFVYAVGRIAVWVPAASPLDPANALRSPNLRHLAIANPEHAPYGRAAEASLRSLGVYDHVKDRLVLGENVAQTLEFVQSGAADAGVIALSLARAPAVRGQGRYWEVPAETYPRLEQGGLILRDSAAAWDFRAWMLSATGARVLEEYGFSLPGK